MGALPRWAKPEPVARRRVCTVPINGDGGEGGALALSTANEYKQADRFTTFHPGLWAGGARALTMLPALSTGGSQTTRSSQRERHTGDN